MYNPAFWYAPMEAAAFASVADIQQFQERRRRDAETFLAEEFASLKIAQVSKKAIRPQ